MHFSLLANVEPIIYLEEMESKVMEGSYEGITKANWAELHMGFCFSTWEENIIWCK